MDDNQEFGWYPTSSDDERTKVVELKRDEQEMDKAIMTANNSIRKITASALEEKLEFRLHQPFDDVPSNRRDSFLKIATKRRKRK